MAKTAFQRYTDQERILQLALHNFKVASERKEGEIRFNHVFIDLERRCNLACRGCYQLMDRDRTRMKLDYDEVTETIDFAHKRGARVIIIAGAGEPTLDEDFRRIIKYIHQKQMYPVIFTNGSTLNTELANFLFDHRVSPIIKKFSMHFEKQDYLIGRKGMSRKMQKGLKTLKEVKEERDVAGKPISEIIIESYISKENIKDIEEILRYCRWNGLIPYLEAFITRGQDEETLKFTPSQKQLNDLFEKLARIDKEEFGIVTLLKQGAPVYGGAPCNKGKVSFAVHVDGSVYECVSGSHKFGNIREEKLENIFSLENNLEVKEFHSSTRYCGACSLNYQPIQ